jgi:acetylornithine deacetylase/succinyl-diaminopimelate desuccinylase-like protein
LILFYLADGGLDVRSFEAGDYPAILAGFPGQLYAPVMLSGHFDVVSPEPDDSQFSPRIEGDYLVGRGAADMKTVVATYLVWMKQRARQGGFFPPVNLLLIGNEERGEDHPMGTAHVLAELREEAGLQSQPAFFIAGERTEEVGKAVWGKVCTENRGVMRFELLAKGQRSHSGLPGKSADLSSHLLQALPVLEEITSRRLTLQSDDGWQSQLRFPFLQVGERGVYNITADTGVLGIEIRPIPGDDLDGLILDLQALCQEYQLELGELVCDPGITCDPENPYLQALISAVEERSGKPVQLGKKLAGTSARFAPSGQGVIWGQSGIGPHAADERHFIPSIRPYYQTLGRFAEKARELKAAEEIEIG